MFDPISSMDDKFKTDLEREVCPSNEWRRELAKEKFWESFKTIETDEVEECTLTAADLF